MKDSGGGNINVAEYIEKGLIDAETFAAKSEPKDLFELVRKEDIDDLMSVFPTARLHYVAADGCALFMREVIDEMDDDTFELYLKYHLPFVNGLIWPVLQAMRWIYLRSESVYPCFQEIWAKQKADSGNRTRLSSLGS